jgi:hypothetical protein
MPNLGEPLRPFGARVGLSAPSPSPFGLRWFRYYPSRALRACMWFRYYALRGRQSLSSRKKT